MTLLQRIKSAFRLIKAGYEAARYTSKRGFWWWGTGSQDAWMDMDKSTVDAIRVKSRHLEHNDWLAQKLATVFTQYVVGADGLQITPASSDPEFNLWAADQWNTASQFIDLETEAGWGDLCWRTTWRRFFDGDAFWLKTRGETGRARLQLIEAHRIKSPENSKDEQRENGSGLSNGVVYDANGRPVSYWIDGTREEESKNIIPLIDRTRARQFRGLPHLTPVINMMADLRTLFGLEMEKAKEHASRALAIQTESGEADPEDLIRLGQSVTSGDATIGQDTETRTKHIAEVTGSSVLFLKQGETVNSIGSESPSAATQWLWDYSIGMVCAGAGISKLLVMPWSLQGTVTRADLDAQAQMFRAQSAIEANAAREAYRYVISFARGQYRGRVPEDWWRCNIRPPRGVNVDVGRNSNAALQELKAGGRTFEGWYSELGLDWRRELRQRSIEAEYILKLAQDANLDPSLISDIVVTPPAAPATEPQPNNA